MARLFRACLLAAMVAGIQCHLCLVSPHQRGSMKGLNTDAADDCYLTTGPCGGRPNEAPTTYLRAGQNFTIVFQKNFGHYFKGHPGMLDVNFGVDATGSTPMMTNLAYIPDTDDPPRTLYTVDIMVPENARGDYVLQVVYTTRNPNAPAMFYQCSDVFVL